ncbi:MAG: DMT family transporter [Candidatus Puniceispirillaceae bacterium]
MAFLPILFVILWSSAFISAKAIMADATAFASLALRFGLVSLGFLIAYGLLQQKQWLTRRQMGHAAITGLLLHGFYLGGVFWALSHGMSATIAALIASLQPIFVALLATATLGEKISAIQWTGIAMGFTGAVLVIGFDFGTTIPVMAVAVCFGALGASIAGTLYQKRFGQDLPMVPANIMQALAATILHIMLIGLFETPQITVSSSFIIGMTWQIVAVSFGAYVMLLFLLQKGTANQTSSLLFLVAPVAAIQAWLLLGEAIYAIDIIGLCLASIGVYFATRKTSGRKTSGRKTSAIGR